MGKETLRRVMLIPLDYEKRFGDKQFIIPEGHSYFEDVCYEDGSPVIYKTGNIIKVGKKRWLEIG